MSEENEETENNSRVDETRKRINRKQLAKSCKFFAVFAVAIMVISSFAVMVKAETPTNVTLLPYELNGIGTNDAEFNLQCLTETTNISVKIWGMSENSVLKLNSENKGTIKAGTQNIFIITATPGSTLSFTSAVGASIRIEEIENTAISSPSNAKITGKTFYKVNSQCYVADIGLPQTETHNITISPDEDLTFFGITQGSISRYNIVNEGSTETIALPKNSYIRLLSEHPVNFNLTVDTVAGEILAESFVTGITAYSQNNPSIFDRLMLYNIEPEKTEYGWNNESIMWQTSNNARWDNTTSWWCGNTSTGEYDPNMNEILLSPSIPLNLSSDPTLSFWTKYDMEGSQWVTIGWTRLL
ncbi:MAG: hypothetical protein QMC80_07640, partial [Thermoplasmatales archaeon]|nr:hypothetical protein [Thermoplasmatales archaeon]